MTRDRLRLVQAATGPAAGGAGMVELIGVPPQVLFGQLLLGLINGSFYALLSLGLAVIFGMLNVINFAHGALYMTGAFTAYFLLQYPRHRLLAGAAAGAADRRRARRRDREDHAHPALQARSPLRPAADLRPRADHRGRCSATTTASPGQPYPIPAALAGGHNLGFMFLPTYRGWVIVASLIVLLRHLVPDRAHAARRLSARRHREPDAGARLRHQRAADDDADLRLRRRRSRRSPACSPRRSTRSTR